MVAPFRCYKQLTLITPNAGDPSSQIHTHTTHKHAASSAKFSSKQRNEANPRATILPLSQLANQARAAVEARRNGTALRAIFLLPRIQGV